MEAQELSLSEKEPKHFKRLFIEVGSGRNPSIFFGRRDLAPDEAHISIERDSKEIKQGKRWEGMSLKKSNPENILFVQGEAKRLPIQNEVTDEIFISNVLSDPEVRDEMALWNGEDIRTWLQEFSRVLRDGGHLVILNANTPEVAPEIEIMQELLIHNNFKIIKILMLGKRGESNAEWDEFVEKYSVAYLSTTMADPESFLIVAEKLSRN